MRIRCKDCPKHQKGHSQARDGSAPIREGAMRACCKSASHIQPWRSRGHLAAESRRGATFASPGFLCAGGARWAGWDPNWRMGFNGSVARPGPIHSWPRRDDGGWRWRPRVRGSFESIRSLQRANLWQGYARELCTHYTKRHSILTVRTNISSRRLGEYGIYMSAAKGGRQI